MYTVLDFQNQIRHLVDKQFHGHLNGIKSALSTCQRIKRYLQLLLLFCYCSPIHYCHANGKPYPSVHTTLGWNTCWHGQVTQPRSEDRSPHRCQYPVCSRCVRWKHGHVHAPACKFSMYADKHQSHIIQILQIILLNCHFTKKCKSSLRICVKYMHI